MSRVTSHHTIFFDPDRAPENVYARADKTRGHENAVAISMGTKKYAHESHCDLTMHVEDADTLLRRANAIEEALGLLGKRFKSLREIALAQELSEVEEERDTLMDWVDVHEASCPGCEDRFRLPNHEMCAWCEAGSEERPAIDRAGDAK